MMSSDFLKSTYPSQTPGSIVTSHNFIHGCDICGVAVHVSCSSNGHKGCKCVAIIGYERVMH